jgi:hypothetical protein
MLSKSELQEIYVKASEGFNDKTISLLHLKSIGNFINYFDFLEYQYQIEVSCKLSDYIDVIKTIKSSVSSEKIDSLFLFSEYVNPIGVIYQKQLDFSLEIKLWMNIITGLILLTFCLILNIFIFNIILLLFLFWYTRRQYKRRQSRKFYKYQY